MKTPQTPPPLQGIMRKCKDSNTFELVLRLGIEPNGDYPHWDKLRHLKPPEGLNSEAWWLGIKIVPAATAPRAGAVFKTAGMARRGNGCPQPAFRWRAQR